MPTPQPVAVTTGTYTQINASGITQASGVSGAYAGPWFIMRQTMEIDYARVPTANWQEETPSALSLSAPMDRTTTIGNTKLQYIVRANVTVEKSYETFDTSSYQQPQKFAILAQVDDLYGNTYGDLSAGQGSPSGPGVLTLGPRGKVVTDQAYYNRRAWTDQDEAVYSSSGMTEGFEGTCGTLSTSSVVMRPNDGGLTSKITAQPYTYSMGQFDHSLRESTDAHTWLYDGTPSFEKFHSVPTIDFGGTYSTAQESDAAIKSWIDSVGVAIATATEPDYTSIFNFDELTGYAKMWPQSVANQQNTDFTIYSPSWLNYPMSFYKASRHDWS